MVSLRPGWLSEPQAWLARPQAWLAGPQAWLAGPQAWLDGPEGGGRTENLPILPKKAVFPNSSHHLAPV